MRLQWAFVLVAFVGMLGYLSVRFTLMMMKYFVKTLNFTFFEK